MLAYFSYALNQSHIRFRHVSGFVTASRQRFVMLHDVKNEDGIKSFFSEMYEVSLEPAVPKKSQYKNSQNM